MDNASHRATHLAQVQEIADIGSWELDVRTDELTWSDECYRLFGIPRGETVTFERFLDRVHPDDRDRVVDAWDAALEGDPYDITHRIVVDGATLWVREKAELEFDGSGEPVYGVGVVQDVTDRKERERELRVFRKAVEAAGHSIYFTDRSGTIKYANPAFEESTGFTAEEATGLNPRILKSGEHDADYYEELWESILSGETWHSEIVNNTKSGERYVVDQTIAPVYDEDGSIHRFVAVNSDITDRKRREEMLAAERDRATELRQRLSVVNRIMRHDLRSAVTIIKGNADLAADGQGDLAERLATIRGEADALLRIGENARLIERTLSSAPRRTTVDLAEVVRTAVADLADSYPNATVDVTMPRQCVVDAHDEIGVAVANLLQNAVVHNDTAEPTVTVTLSTEDGLADLSIADDGPGIPDAEVVPLERDVEDPLEHSSGLGLWVVSWLVRVSAGDLSFEANDPRGTVVTIGLGLADDQA